MENIGKPKVVTPIPFIPLTKSLGWELAEFPQKMCACSG